MATTTRPPAPPPVTPDMLAGPPRATVVTGEEQPARPSATVADHNGTPPRAAAPAAQILVRPARPGDLAGVQHVVQACGQAGGLDTSNWSPILLVAEYHGQIIGMIQAIPAQPHAVITTLCVAPDYRGSRAGYLLIQGAELALRLAGCTAWACYADLGRDDWGRTIQRWGAVEDPRLFTLFQKRLDRNEVNHA